MQANKVMSYILIGILLVCGYIYCLQVVARRTTNRAAMPLISILLLVLYLCIGIPFVIIIFSMGSLDFVLLALLSALSFAIIFSALAGLFRNFSFVNKGMLALFITYTLAVAYITVFSRDGSNDTSIYMVRSDLIQEVMRTHSLEPLHHSFLNMLMFIPMGFLLPCVYPEKLDHWSYAILMGLMCTTAIESIQLLLRLGQADLTDVITNALGALLGYLIYKVFKRFMPKWEDVESESP